MTSHLFVLEPKYQACRPADTTRSSLGAILVADMTGGAGVVAVVEAAIRAGAEPWCPVVLLTRSSPLETESEAVIGQFDMTPAVLDLAGTANLLDPAPILLSVRQRPCPTPQRLARFVTDRVDRPELADTLEECFCRGLDNEDGSGVSRSTLSRRLHDFEPLKPRDWAGMARTLAVLLEADCDLGQSSQLHDVDPRTVRSHIKLYTGFDFGEVRKQPGWEWVVEAALQRWDYVAQIPAKAPAMRQRASGEQHLS
jgi:hypothetical protein